MPSPCSIQGYLWRFESHLDVAHLALVRNEVGSINLLGRPGQIFDTSVGAWAGVWNHRSDRGALDLRYESRPTNSQTVHCQLEVGYKSLLLEKPCRWIPVPTFLIALVSN